MPGRRKIRSTKARERWSSRNRWVDQTNRHRLHPKPAEKKWVEPPEIGTRHRLRRQCGFGLGVEGVPALGANTIVLVTGFYDGRFAGGEPGCCVTPVSKEHKHFGRTFTINQNELQHLEPA
jgi:hypothetical protein